MSFPHVASNITDTRLCLLNLLPEDGLERVSVSGKLANTFAELVDCHWGLVEVETEERLVVKVFLLLNVERRSPRCIELLWYGLLAVVKLLEKGWLCY